MGIGNAWQGIRGLVTTLQDNRKNTPKDIFENSGGTGGQQYNYLADLLKSYIDSGSPGLDQARQISTSAINKSYDLGQTKLNETFADKGTFGSGVMANAAIGLEGGRANALAGNEANLASINEATIQQAIGNLLNLNQGQANRSLSQFNIRENSRLAEDQLQFQKDNQPSDFMQFLGNIFGGASQVGTAYLLNK
jgi:hypothetical protein